ncbi:MAG TPA: penicillin-binding transpeptidase domain-containing protein [Planctomycetaceae bacterium]|jgi:penicillin-binding protein 2|nr:penicillin-binding transpeptidase domain-containing protein [Planctomycetaceae bacterium]
MRNRAINVLSEGAPAGGRLDSAWHVDEHPAGRLVWLFVLIALPLAAVAARLVQLDCWLVDDYVATFATTTESVESVPSMDGRIYGSDGRVLAEDVERDNIRVHYRWLEDPPDERWLSQQALSKLPRAERRNRARVEAEKRRVLARRDAMWQRLSDLSGTSPADLATKRSAIQKRVEHIADGVARRHSGSDGESVTASKAVEAARPLAQRVWDVVVATLTTPPRREEREPIVVREELDYHTIVDDVPLAVRAEIEAHPRWFPGVRVGSTSRRVYYDSGLSPHVIGARLPVTDGDLASRASQSANDFAQDDPLDYRAGDRIGRTGVEASYDSCLRGLRGLRKLVRNRYGEVVREEMIRAPRPGGNVELTLNAGVQRKMEQLLDALLTKKAQSAFEHDDSRPPTGGCVVAIDVQSGAVLVAAGAPRFDFGASAVPDAQTWKRLSDDPRHPLFHRAIQMALPPGSVFKVLSAVALLESRRIDPDVRYDCRGYLDKPDRLRCLVFTQQGVGHGLVDLGDALSRSCNVYFFHAAGVMGPQPIVEWARRFGIGRPTGVDLPFEHSGNLPEPDATASGDGRKSSGAAWHIADTRALAIGQSSLTVTPLQIARVMAAIANGGYLVTPFVARKAGPQLADDESDLSFSRRQPIPGLSEGTLARIRAALVNVVARPTGTGYKTVRAKEIAIAGKTGTAQVSAGQADHAWFAGYAPADKPRIAFAVVLEHAGSGGKAAGPVARQLVEAFLADGVLEPARITMRE